MPAKSLDGKSTNETTLSLRKGALNANQKDCLTPRGIGSSKSANDRKRDEKTLKPAAYNYRRELRKRQGPTRQKQIFRILLMGEPHPANAHSDKHSMPVKTKETLNQTEGAGLPT